MSVRRGAGGGTSFVWFDEFRMVRNSSAVWTKFAPHQWDIDKQARDIVFKLRPPYALMKIKGGSKPTVMASDSSTADIDDSYIQAFACFKAAPFHPDPTLRTSLMALWAQRSQIAMRKLRLPSTVREVI